MPVFPSLRSPVGLEPQLLAAMEDHPGTLGALFAAGEHDRGDQAEGDGVVHALRWASSVSVVSLSSKVVDQPTDEAAAGAGGNAAREWAPRREVAEGGAAAAGTEVDALEGAPGNQDPAVAPVVDVDPAVALAGFAGAGEDDVAPVEERHEGTVARVARDGADGVERKVEQLHRRRCGRRSSSVPTPSSRFHWTNPVKSPWGVRTIPCSRSGAASSRAVGRSSTMPICRSLKSTTPRLGSHTRRPSAKSSAEEAVEVEHGPALDNLHGKVIRVLH